MPGKKSTKQKKPTKRGPLTPSNKLARRDQLAIRMEKNIKRDELASALSHHTEDNKSIGALVDRLLDPEYAKVSLGTLCQRSGTSLHQLMDLFRKTKMDEGLIRAFKHVPDMLEDTAKDALSKEESCWKCQGDKEITVDDETSPCPECKGKGITIVPGNTEARKLMFETTGLTGKRGPLIAQQFNLGGGADSQEDVLKNVHRLMERGSDGKGIIDAEIVE